MLYSFTSCNLGYTIAVLRYREIVTGDYIVAGVAYSRIRTRTRYCWPVSHKFSSYLLDYIVIIYNAFYNFIIFVNFHDISY